MTFPALRGLFDGNPPVASNAGLWCSFCCYTVCGRTVVLHVVITPASFKNTFLSWIWICTVVHSWHVPNLRRHDGCRCPGAKTLAAMPLDRDQTVISIISHNIHTSLQPLNKLCLEKMRGRQPNWFPYYWRLRLLTARTPYKKNLTSTPGVNPTLRMPHMPSCCNTSIWCIFMWWATSSLPVTSVWMIRCRCITLKSSHFIALCS